MYRIHQDPIHTIHLFAFITKGLAAVPTSFSFADRRFEIATCILSVHQSNGTMRSLRRFGIS